MTAFRLWDSGQRTAGQRQSGYDALLNAQLIVKPQTYGGLKVLRFQEMDDFLEGWIDAEKQEQTLAEAQANRELAASLLDGEWLGLKVLAYLRTTSPIALTDLASLVTADVNQLGPILAQMVRAGIVDVEQMKYTITRRGKELLGTLEQNLGVSLGVESELQKA